MKYTKTMTVSEIAKSLLRLVRWFSASWSDNPKNLYGRREQRALNKQTGICQRLCSL